MTSCEGKNVKIVTEGKTHYMQKTKDMKESTLVFRNYASEVIMERHL